MKKRVTILLLSAIIIISCRDKDGGLDLCQPHALLYETDSIVYAYVDGHVKTAKYYTSGLLNYQDDIQYNASGQPVIVAKSFISVDGRKLVVTRHELIYENGYPSQLVSDGYDGYFTTTFTHNESGQLITAETSAGRIRQFIGTTRYEYDANGNIPKVYYTIRIFEEKKEVLARENTAFDEQEKFYNDTPDLKLMNEYVYGYLPNKNNCLGSTLYYYSYAQHFASPLDLTFAASYDDEGKIKSLQSDGSGRSYSGEVLFKSAVYECH